MTAAFPWYDLPSVRWANDALWQAMGLGGALDRATPVETQWRAEDLVVSQACGLDLFLADAPIEPVLAPVFDLDCEEGCYYSYLVGAREGIAAVNSLSSRSGLSALLTVCEPRSLIRDRFPRGEPCRRARRFGRHGVHRRRDLAHSRT